MGTNEGYVMGDGMEVLLLVSLLLPCHTKSNQLGGPSHKSNDNDALGMGPTTESLEDTLVVITSEIFWWGWTVLYPFVH